MGCALKRVEETKVPYWKGKFPIMVIAHRGFSGAAPENTLAAFRKAIDVGSDLIELDIQLSKDGKIVVIHDEILGRATNGQGKVSDHTLQELKKLDAGSKFRAEFSGERIPTLQEVLDLAKGRVLVNIEIKDPTYGQYPITELADKALKEVKKAGMMALGFPCGNHRRKAIPGAQPPEYSSYPGKGRQNPQRGNEAQRLHGEYGGGTGAVREVGGGRDHHQLSGSAHQNPKSKVPVGAIHESPLPASPLADF